MTVFAGTDSTCAKSVCDVAIRIAETIQKMVRFNELEFVEKFDGFVSADEMTAGRSVAFAKFLESYDSLISATQMQSAGHKAGRAMFLLIESLCDFQAELHSTKRGEWIQSVVNALPPELCEPGGVFPRNFSTCTEYLVFLADELLVRINDRLNDDSQGGLSGFSPVFAVKSACSSLAIDESVAAPLVARMRFELAAVTRCANEAASLPKEIDPLALRKAEKSSAYRRLCISAAKKREDKRTSDAATRAKVALAEFRVENAADLKTYDPEKASRASWPSRKTFDDWANKGVDILHT
ncbi:hypothetical protein [Rhodopirellula sp. SWK7]|uniref:hypothetical protein n=1 Tax=Rhodopirellula sp. SWK7 TaxID=595460 RepID=UPI0005C52E7B|nr:hypothetical protein [Rhodopirellula sp. SWK7]